MHYIDNICAKYDYRCRIAGNGKIPGEEDYKSSSVFLHRAPATQHVGAWGAAGDPLPTAVIIAAAASRARPAQSTLGSLARRAGTGTNGEHCLLAIGNGSPPFAPMPLPSFAHYRRGMGCGGQPIANRGDHRRRRTPCPARPIHIGQFGSYGGHGDERRTLSARHWHRVAAVRPHAPTVIRALSQGHGVRHGESAPFATRTSPIVSPGIDQKMRLVWGCMRMFAPQVRC